MKWSLNRPRKVEVNAISTIAGNTAAQIIPDRSAKNTAMIIGTNALATPNNMAPDVLDSIRRFSGIGANRSLSKERLLFSNVMVTASKEVVPKRIEMLTTPGRIPGTLSRPVPDLMKNIPVQASGNSSPQLILGGLV